MAEPPRVTFATTLVQTGGSTTGIRVPDGAVAALGAGKRPRSGSRSTATATGTRSR